MNPDSHLVISQSRKLFEIDDSAGSASFVRNFQKAAIFVYLFSSNK